MSDKQFSELIRVLGDIKMNLSNINTAINAVGVIVFAIWIYSILNK